MRAAAARLIIIAGATALLVLAGHQAMAAWLIFLGSAVALVVPLEYGPRLAWPRRRRRPATRSRRPRARTR